MFSLLSLARIAYGGVIMLSVAGCSISGSADTVRSLVVSPAGDERTLLVATTRSPDRSLDRPPFFTGDRGRSLVFALAHARTERNAVTRQTSTRIAAVEVIARQNAAEVFAREVFGRDVLLYVHGFRETFETAALGAVGLSEGIEFRGATGIFTWPSQGKTFSYVHDRESAMWSRDALEDLLTALTKRPGGGRVHIVAHSMGSALVLEALRTLQARGDTAMMARLGAMVLASPDVDIDLFIQAMERLGPDARRVTVITAENDRALEISRRLAGGVVRAGAAERERLDALGVTVADATSLGRGLFNHDLFLSNDEVKAVVRRAIERSL